MWMKERFAELLRTAEEGLRTRPGAAQVIALETESGEIRWFANDLSADTEVHLVRSLSAVVRMVCMWPDGSINLPSMHLRRLLVEADPRNEHTRMLLSSGSGPMVRTIGRSMP